MVAILANPRPSGLVTEVCAETIVVDVRFNGWVALSGKELTSDDDMMALLDAYEELNEECAAAVAAYRLSILDNPAATLEEHRVADAELVRTLRSVQQSLRDLSR